MSDLSPEYAEFLASKAPRPQAVGIEPGAMPAHLFDYQAECVAFGLRQGRAAMLLDTGMGKTRIQLEWARQAAEASNGRALILAPLTVGWQIAREGQSLGYNVRTIREASEARDGISVCNYDRLDRLDAARFGAGSLDESGILKSFTGATTRALIQAFAGHRFRLAATATPAPNDHMELGQHAEFLGIMPSNEMLARWFVSDQTQMGRYRLKGHAQTDFWDWIASWSRCAETPEDLGFDGSAFVLPELRVIRHQAMGDVRPAAGSLFVSDLSATNIHDVKRQTAEARADAVASVVHAEPDEAWVIFCDTDYEADALAKRLPEAVEIRGSHQPEKKEASLSAFVDGQAKWLISKPSICGLGMNFQHAARMAFVGRTFSYEAWYQAVRRCWRFGQARDVDVHLIVAEGEEQIGRVIDRKAEDHRVMKRAMAEAMRRARAQSSVLKAPYQPNHIGRIPAWLRTAA